ncbi:Amidohydrolase 3 [Catenulispora acidiphila DSM 44928]|uniref:Amidohydrolase 3 n=1 Tax=Catenulispora acidiphila (strain DSM 44928 / JCM 14897 / NBRC 102108 / NRRL B-24433 / ID139908) TaxID=479433 RepID=C7Q1T3_CATAD|nr:amidohydrolase [Catenulispora acidiphila]ACU75634.1 Amidohydrolase 3 [Catenulispora acidiphila DSM 44928]
MSDIPVIRHADLILRGGRVHTLDAADTVVSSLAVAGGRIAAAGDDRETAVLLGPDTEVVDLAGRVVVPGLHDSHLHLTDAGNSWNLQVRWDGVPSLADALKLLALRAAEAAPGQWVQVIGGWSDTQFAEHRLPTLAEIESVSADVPVLVVFLDTAAFLNAAALRALGYDQTTPDPPGGEIQRDTAGNPTGLLLSRPSPAVLALAVLGAPQLKPSEQVGSTDRFLRELSRRGVTGAIDAGATGIPGCYDALRTLRAQNRLPVRTALNVMASRPGEEREELATLLRGVTFHDDDMLWFNGIGEALTLDGVDFSNFAQPRPALSDAMGRHLEPLVRLLASNRWPFSFHATYEESISRFLGVLEKVNRDVPFDGLRWAVEHAETIRPQTIDRVAALGGGITVQHRMAYRGEQFLKRYGPEAARHVQPVMEMLTRGVPVGGGTDGTWMADANPWGALRWFTTGTTLGGLEMWRPEDRLDRTLALRLFTGGSAWFTGEAHQRGALEPGMLADFAVLSADYFSVPENEIADVESVLTVVGGAVVHAAGPYARP